MSGTKVVGECNRESTGEGRGECNDDEGGAGKSWRGDAVLYALVGLRDGVWASSGVFP